MKKEVYLNKAILFALCLNYCAYRMNIGTTDNELIGFGFLTVVSFLMLIYSIGKFIGCFMEK